MYVVKKAFLLLFTLILTVLLAAGCGGRSEETAPEGDLESITVEKSCIYAQDDGEVAIMLEVPVLSGLADRSLQERINKEFENKALDFQSESLEPLADYREDAEKNGWDAQPFVVQTAFTVPFNQDSLLSINFTYYAYQGGAHGFSYMETLNLDINTGQTLHLKDFFEPGDDYQRIVLEEIHRQIEANPENYFEEARETLTAIPTDQQFYMGDGCIVVYFDLYYLAPYAYGLPEFIIRQM
jgi:hypothetical protein